jgi:predicted ATPase/DNA-binding XRE family transcriptional regulator/Tfp pilus assembly protein PilF
MADMPFPTNARAFGALLRTYRLAAGLTQEELAERAGLSLRGVSDLERGARQYPRLETVRMLADGLGFDPGTPEWVALLAARNDQETSPVPSERSRLPTPPTALIGRDREVASIVETLDREQVRQLTVVGPGGVGKTRLALEVAEGLADRFPDGTTFTDLTPVRDPALVLSTIASALGVRDTGTGSLVEEIVSTIGHRRHLLILDNVEQVVEAAPEIAHLLASCPNLTVLATSRVALRLTAEHLYTLDPLDLPGQDAASRLEDLAKVPAVALFIARARAADPHFNLTDANAGTVATLVRRLEGLPLAIELAAARIRALPPVDLLDRLERQLPLLTGGPRDAPPRHWAMRDAIAWSYDLLDADEQSLFRRLAVFVGGFTLEAAEAVAGMHTDLDILAGLSGLMDASLLHRDVCAEGPPRFGMLETIREFGLEQLAAQGEDERVRDAHAAYFLAFATSSQAAKATEEEGQAPAARIDAERGNLRAALARLTRRQRIDEALELAVATWPFRANYAYDVEARTTIESLIAHPCAPDRSTNRAHALLTLSHFALRQGDIDESMRVGQEALAIFRENGDTVNVGRVHVSLAWAFMDVSRHDEAIERFEAALEVAKTTRDEEGMIAAHDLMGWLHVNRNEYEAASAHLQEALRISDSTGNRLRRANALGHLAVLSVRQQEFALARRRFEESIAIAREMGDYHLLASTLLLCADLVCRDGALASAESIVQEAHDISHKTGYTHGIAGTLFAMGRLAVRRGRQDEALGFLKQSAIAYQRIGLRYGTQYCAMLTYDGLACLAYETGDLSRSVRFLAMGDALLARNNIPRPAGGLHFFERGEIDRIREQLADPELAERWQSAHALSEQEMVEEALTFTPTWAGSRRSV